MNWKDLPWFDFLKVMKDEPIVVKDAFGFGLKAIAKNLEKHGLTTDHIVLSSGSTAVLMNVALASLKKGHILAPDLFWDSTANLASDVSQNKLKRLPSNIKHEINLAHFIVFIYQRSKTKQFR